MPSVPGHQSESEPPLGLGSFSPMSLLPLFSGFPDKVPPRGIFYPYGLGPSPMFRAVCSAVLTATQGFSYQKPAWRRSIPSLPNGLGLQSKAMSTLSSQSHPALEMLKRPGWRRLRPHTSKVTSLQVKHVPGQHRVEACLGHCPALCRRSPGPAAR